MEALNKLFSGKRGRAVVMATLGVAALCFIAIVLTANANVPAWTPLALVAAGLLALLVSAVGVARYATPQAASQAAAPVADQEAIMRLLDDISALAEGDLTIEPMVTEDITGTIADSIAYTVGSLRELVSTINRTAEEVASVSQDSLGTAKKLTQASQTQSQKILSATESIQSVVESIQSVSRDAQRAKEVTQRSVEVANNGTTAVRRNIEGMGAIREQIQETSKRIKRLGESSQEIGDIVELINDIAEQTNTLALNASIQAAMAGEAGRGFAVVADEVQRLAERSASATRQIEALVRTIQADTNEAVISMEKSTAGVVSGARLAENAGGALEEIGTVSQQMSSLISGMTAQTDAQTQQANQISETMLAIRTLTEQTGTGAQASGRAIARLAELGGQLRASVSGFTLPNESGGDSQASQQPGQSG